MATNNKTQNAAFTEEEAKQLVAKYLGGYKLTANETQTLIAMMQANPSLAQYIRANKQKAQNRRRSANNGSSGGYGGGNGGMSSQYATRGNLNQQLRQRGNGWGGGSSGRVTSPGGFKKSGMDEDSQARMSGDITPERVRNRVNFDERGGASFNGRSYTKAQMDAIMKRGMTGATLSVSDQALYDAKIRQMDEEEQMRRDSARNQEIANANALSNRRADIKNGVAVPKLNDGMEWSATQKQEYAKLSQALEELEGMDNVDRINVIREGKNAGLTDYEVAKEQIQQKMRNIINNPRMKLNNQLSEEEFIAKMKRNGGYLDDKQQWHEWKDADKKQQREDEMKFKAEMDAAEKEQRMQADKEAKALQGKIDARNKHIADKLNDARSDFNRELANWQKAKDNKDLDETETPKPVFDRDAAIKQISEDYDAIFGAPPQPQAQEGNLSDYGMQYFGDDGMAATHPPVAQPQAQEMPPDDGTWMSKLDRIDKQRQMQESVSDNGGYAICDICGMQTLDADGVCHNENCPSNNGAAVEDDTEGFNEQMRRM